MVERIQSRGRINLLIPESVVFSIWRLVDYLWSEEKRDFEEQRRVKSSFSESHIFRDLDRVNNWLMSRSSAVWANLAIGIVLLCLISIALGEIPNNTGCISGN